MNRGSDDELEKRRIEIHFGLVQETKDLGASV